MWVVRTVVDVLIESVSPSWVISTRGLEAAFTAILRSITFTPTQTSNRKCERACVRRDFQKRQHIMTKKHSANALPQLNAVPWINTTASTKTKNIPWDIGKLSSWRWIFFFSCACVLECKQKHKQTKTSKPCIGCVVVFECCCVAAYLQCLSAHTGQNLELTWNAQCFPIMIAQETVRSYDKACLNPPPQT